MKLFIDANVIVDVVLRRISSDGKPLWATSLLLLDDIAKGKYEGVTSVLSLYITYVLLNPKKRKRDDVLAKEKIRNLTSILKVVQLSNDILESALRETKLMFEDAIQFFSAKNSSANAIVTRNIKDFKKVMREIRIMTPEEVLGMR